VVIAGHGRLLAAKAMGMAEVPTIELVGLSEVQKRALRLADNKIALGAGWDLDVLKVELAELSALDIDMDLTINVPHHCLHAQYDRRPRQFQMACFSVGLTWPAARWVSALDSTLINRRLTIPGRSFRRPFIRREKDDP
jgi:hypothetical protein